jgi:hypothetical protein
MIRLWIATIFLLGSALLAACGTPPAQEATLTSPPPPTYTFAPTDTATPTVDKTATQNAQQTADAQATADAMAATQTQAAFNKAAVLTEVVAGKKTSTAQVKATATSYAMVFLEVVQQLQEAGVVIDTEGYYRRPKDFDQSWAQLGWFRWWHTGYTAENFVLSAEASWESASKTSDWDEAGCGIVFSENDHDNYHLAYLSLDGYGRLQRKAKGDWKILAKKQYGKLSVPDGNAKIMLVVDDKIIHFYVNDELVAKAYDNSLNEGTISLTLLSGTNKGFGTRCKMTNINLFILE